MIGLTDREEKLLRLAVDAGATDGEARAAGAKLISMLRARRYKVGEGSPTDQEVAKLRELCDSQARQIADLTVDATQMQAEVEQIIAERDRQMARISRNANEEIAQLRAALAKAMGGAIPATPVVPTPAVPTQAARFKWWAFIFGGFWYAYKGMWGKAAPDHPGQYRRPIDTPVGS